MSFTERDAADGPPLPIGISAALVAPTALFGTLMIADYPGPNSFAVLFGWWAICLAIMIGTAQLFRRFRAGAQLRPVFLLLGIGVPLGFAAFLYADIHPDTPLGVKAAVERLMEIVGVLTLVACPVFMAWRWWDLSQFLRR